MKPHDIYNIYLNTGFPAVILMVFNSCTYIDLRIFYYYSPDMRYASQTLSDTDIRLLQTIDDNCERQSLIASVMQT